MSSLRRPQTRYRNFINDANNPAMHHWLTEELEARTNDHMTRKALAAFFANMERIDKPNSIQPHSFTITKKDGYCLATLRASKKQQPLIGFVRGANQREAFVNLSFSLEHGWISWREDKPWRKNGR